MKNMEKAFTCVGCYTRTIYVCIVVLYVEGLNHEVCQVSVFLKRLPAGKMITLMEGKHFTSLG